MTDQDAMSVSSHPEEEESDFEGIEEDFESEPEKDDAELELERLVFGDETGLRDRIETQVREQKKESFNWSHAGVTSAATGKDLEKSKEEAGDLEALQDADLFFFDSGPDKISKAVASLKDQDSEDSSDDEPAWVDSDDERVTVSLATDSRLRKLRTYEGEDVINGREYTRRLRKQFELLHPRPDWAIQAQVAAKERSSRHDENWELGSDDEDVMHVDGDDDSLEVLPLAKLLRNNISMTVQRSASGKAGRLKQDVIDIQRLKNIGETQPSAVNCLSFHPRYPLILSSGPASTTYLHQVEPSALEANPLLTSLHIKDTPLSTTAFLNPLGNKIFMSSRRRYFHIWDLESGMVEKVTRVYAHQREQRSMESFKLSPCGRWMALVGSTKKGGGVINILDAETTQWATQVRVEGKGGIADFAWWRNGEGLTTVSKGGEVGEWSLAKKGYLCRWRDDGAFGVTVLSLGGRRQALLKDSGAGNDELSSLDLGPDRWVAIGSSSGIVNVYDRSEWTISTLNASPHPKPSRTFDQLVTPISNITFSPDGQFLSMSSRWKKNALKLVHLPTLVIYRNWPTSVTPLGRVTSVAIAPDSRMLAIGNEAGKIRLWELRS